MGLARVEAEQRLSDARATLAALLAVDDAGLALPEGLPAGPPPARSGRRARSRTQALAPAGRGRGRRDGAPGARAPARGHPPRAGAQPDALRVLRTRRDQRQHHRRRAVVPVAAAVTGRADPRRARSPRRWRRSAPRRAREELVRRRVRLEVARALAALPGENRRRGAVRGRSPGAGPHRSARRCARRSRSRQLTLREGLVWQRSLIELLQTDIEVRLGRALAWVELQRVVGLPLAPAAGGSP